MSEATSGHETERAEVKFNESDTRPGFSTSSRAGAAMTDSGGYMTVKEDVVLSAGIGGDLISSSSEHAAWLSGSALIPLSFSSSRNPGHEKIGFGGTKRWALSAGVEGRAGLSILEPVDGERSSQGLFTLLPAVDITLLTTLDL